MKKTEWIVTSKCDEDIEIVFTRFVDALAFMYNNGVNNFELVKLVFEI